VTRWRASSPSEALKTSRRAAETMQRRQWPCMLRTNCTQQRCHGGRAPWRAVLSPCGHRRRPGATRAGRAARARAGTRPGRLGLGLRPGPGEAVQMRRPLRRPFAALGAARLSGARSDRRSHPSVADQASAKEGGYERTP
jgi:hypothetical protein